MRLFNLFAFFMIGLGVAMAGCAGVSKDEVSKVPPTVSPLEPMVASHREKAQDLELEGDLRKALDEWKIALIMDRKDTIALERKKKLEERIKHEVAQRLSQGKEAIAQGNHIEARSHFLAVLAIDPSNKAAFEALRTDVKEVRFLNHTVRKGETLRKIAQLFYGDPSRFEVIWEVNQLPPRPKLIVGSTLKIPEIPGVPFVRRRRSRGRQSQPVSGDIPSKDKVSKDVPIKVNPTLAAARQSLEKAEYRLALIDIERYLSSAPLHSEAVELKKRVLYGLGKAELDKEEYKDAFFALDQLAKLAPDYQDSAFLLQQVRARLIREHYNEGIRFYREEKLEAAIIQWRAVFEYEPSHAGARQNIEQAERLLEALQKHLQKK